MKKVLLSLFCIPMLGVAQDTIMVQSHDDTHMNWYGNYTDTTEFPNTSDTYRRIIMEYDLGCPTNDCSDWDYTNQINLIEPTGLMDSTLKTHTNFKVNGNALDSLFYSASATVNYSYNTTTNTVDTITNDALELVLYSDAANPTQPTDTLTVYPSNFYQYSFDGSGNLLDSTLFNAGDESSIFKTLHQWYKVFEVKHKIELGRVITPYGGNLTDSWYRRFTFDVTEFAPLLKGEKVIESHYSGWSDGFTATVRFYFVKGTPDREVIDFQPLWHTGASYGKMENGVHTIENQIDQRKYFMSAGAKYAELTFTPTGHGFGGNGNPENCAEFCSKYVQVFSNSTFLAQRDVWKDDCGSNAHYPQPGTWLYDRANWCPGEQTPKFIFGLDNATADDTNTVDVNFELYPNGVGGSYIVDGFVTTYGEFTHNNNASVEDILAPSNKYDYHRFNPICGQPIIKVQNRGKNDITSLKIEYSIDGLETKTYDYNGSIKPMEFEEITLPSFNPQNFIEENNTTFTAKITEVNGGVDESTVDNTRKSTFTTPPSMPANFVVRFKTNKYPQQNKWKIIDEDGNTVQERLQFAVNTTNYDTVHLSSGCYTFILEDSQRDGLKFGFPNHDNYYGTGSINLRKADGASGPSTLKSFNSNFGTEIRYTFTVGLYPIGQEEIEVSESNIYPNPSNGWIQFNENLEGDVQISVLDVLGKTVKKTILNSVNSGTNYDLSDLQNGTYFIHVLSANKEFTEKVVLKK
jgi:hypothetical protein